MRKYAIIVALLAAMAGAGVGLAGSSGADQFAQINFDDAASNVTLVIPTPACRPQGCQWEMIEWTIAADGTQTQFLSGNAGEGSILLPFPSDYCGQIQVDVGVIGDDGQFHKDRGDKHSVATCESTTTTTAVGCPPNGTPPPCTTTTEAPTTTVPPVGTVPPAVSPPTPPTLAPAEATTPATIPGQLPNIPPEQNGVTQGNG